jgi:hypothetical protein
MIRSGIPYSFKKELLQGVHDFENDMFGMALYRSTASLDPASTTVYVESGEITGGGYDQGGVIVDCAIRIDEGKAVVDFTDVQWTGEIVARGALIFNVTKDSKAVAILDFEFDRHSQDGVFKVRFPRNGHAQSLLAIA